MSTFTEDLEEHIVVLQMWAQKREKDMPRTGAWLLEAVADLVKALEYAEKRT